MLARILHYSTKSLTSHNYRITPSFASYNGVLYHNLHLQVRLKRRQCNLHRQRNRSRPPGHAAQSNSRRNAEPRPRAHRLEKGESAYPRSSHWKRYVLGPLNPIIISNLANSSAKKHHTPKKKKKETKAKKKETSSLILRTKNRNLAPRPPRLPVRPHKHLHRHRHRNVLLPTRILHPFKYILPPPIHDSPLA